MSKSNIYEIGRRNPASGVLNLPNQPTIAFLTVCTLRREPGLANPTAHTALVTAWTEADTWLVGAYVIMPNHIHLFCAPKDEEITIEHWISF
jgi:putative transposase